MSYLHALAIVYSTDVRRHTRPYRLAHRDEVSCPCRHANRPTTGHSRPSACQATARCRLHPLRAQCINQATFFAWAIALNRPDTRQAGAAGPHRQVGILPCARVPARRVRRSQRPTTCTATSMAAPATASPAWRSLRAFASATSGPNPANPTRWQPVTLPLLAVPYLLPELLAAPADAPSSSRRTSPARTPSSHTAASPPVAPAQSGSTSTMITCSTAR